MLLHILHQNKASLFYLATYNPISFLTFVFSTLGPRSKDLFRLLTCPWMPKSILKAVLPQFSFLSCHDTLLNVSCTFPALQWQLNSFFGKQLLDVLVLYGWDIVAGEQVVLMLQQPQHCSPNGGYFQDGAKKKLPTKSILIQSAQISSQKQKEKLKVIPMFIIVSLHQQEIFPYFILTRDIMAYSTLLWVCSRTPKLN